MTSFKLFFCLSGFVVSSLLFGAKITQAQIISQTPAPEIPVDTANEIETLTKTPTLVRPGIRIQSPRPAALLFAGFDRNGDYKIDKREVKDGINRAFLQADQNKDNRLSLIELERWRIEALGSLNAAPGNYAFAPDFSRSISPTDFKRVLNALAVNLDTDTAGQIDGIINFSDLLKDVLAPRTRKKEKSCIDEVRAERQRVEQQCRRNRGY